MITIKDKEDFITKFKIECDKELNSIISILSEKLKNTISSESKSLDDLYEKYLSFNNIPLEKITSELIGFNNFIFNFDVLDLKYKLFQKTLEQLLSDFKEKQDNISFDILQQYHKKGIINDDEFNILKNQYFNH